MKSKVFAKFGVILMAVIMIFSLAACGNNPPDNENKTNEDMTSVGGNGENTKKRIR